MQGEEVPEETKSAQEVATVEPVTAASQICSDKVEESKQDNTDVAGSR